MKLTIPIVAALASLATTSHAALVAHWAFDGDFLDSSGMGNHLTVAGGSPTLTGAIAPFGTGAVDFNPGNSDWLHNTTPTGFGFTTYTVAAWLNHPLPVSHPEYHSLFWRGPSGVGSDIEFYVQSLSLDWILIHNRNTAAPLGFLQTPANPPASTTYHFAVTYDGTTMTAYYNGVFAGSNTVINPTVSAGHQIAVGNFDHSLFPNKFFDGLVDEMVVFDEALTPTEIDDLISNNVGAPIPEPSRALVSLAGLAAIALRRRRK